MAATTLSTSADSPDPAVVERAAALLRAGRLVAIPTETVYGLGGDALDRNAVQAIFAAKGRPATDPLIVHVDGVQMLDRVIAGPLPPKAAELAEAFWPGPLTLVVPRGPAVPPEVSSGLDTVAVRCPSHPVAAAIISAAGTPIAAPSANRFGQISPTSAGHVVAELGDRIELIVDAGRAERGLESTVVAFDGDQAIILRHGAVTAEQLAAVVPITDARDTSTQAAASPGHDERHYSPGAPTLAVVAGFDPASGPTGTDVVYAGYTDRTPAIPDGWRFESLGHLGDLDTVAHDLYDGLRRIDDTRPSLILVELSGAAGIGRAIDDRLTRAGSSIVLTDVDELRRRLG